MPAEPKVTRTVTRLEAETFMHLLRLQCEPLPYLRAVIAALSEEGPCGCCGGEGTHDTGGPLGMRRCCLCAGTGKVGQAQTGAVDHVCTIPAELRAGIENLLGEITDKVDENLALSTLWLDESIELHAMHKDNLIAVRSGVMNAAANLRRLLGESDGRA